MRWAWRVDLGFCVFHVEQRGALRAFGGRAGSRRPPAPEAPLFHVEQPAKGSHLFVHKQEGFRAPMRPLALADGGRGGMGVERSCDSEVAVPERFSRGPLSKPMALIGPCDKGVGLRRCGGPEPTGS
jgi:hypothetical protein